MPYPYSTQASKRTFSDLSAALFASLQSWARRRHPKKRRCWVNRKYWHAIDNANWGFAARSGQDHWIRLAHHADTAIRRFSKVQGSRSPYDGDWLYWATRRGKSPLISHRTASLLKRQKGRCNACNLFFMHGDVIELDHIIHPPFSRRSRYRLKLATPAQTLSPHQIRFRAVILLVVMGLFVSHQVVEEPDVWKQCAVVRIE